jgi:alpha-tubulin suppressor-like RCC1 family protein
MLHLERFHSAETRWARVATTALLMSLLGGESFAQVTTAVNVSAGEAHTCGIFSSLLTGGPAYCWGRNANGELGDGTTTPSQVPRTVSGGYTFASVSAGRDHSCGVVTGGVAYCWGRNTSGQLGDRTTTASAVPTQVRGGLTFALISAGGEQSCGITTDGTAYCWGGNSAGQLGVGTSVIQVSTPVPVAVGRSLSSTTASFHTCAVVTPGGAGYCWGGNSNGELGDGTTTSSRIPVPVYGSHTFW